MREPKQRFRVFIHDHDRWVKGGLFSSRHAAVTAATKILERTGLFIEVRTEQGEVVHRFAPSAEACHISPMAIAHPHFTQPGGPISSS